MGKLVDLVRNGRRDTASTQVGAVAAAGVGAIGQHPVCLAPGLMEALNPRRMRFMAAPRKYPDELRERATRMAVDARRDPATRAGALKRIGEQLGINPETLRNWVIQAEIDEGHRPGTTTDDATRLAELERENRELRRANAILKSASAFFAAELDRPSR
ncbi:hypothetical protein D0Z06_20000 [Geodermatophilus marinus]|nr:hypothetical protein D0Z06_20000 [Geodermatophilus sp. LHW52908]